MQEKALNVFLCRNPVRAIALFQTAVLNSTNVSAIIASWSGWGATVLDSCFCICVFVWKVAHVHARPFSLAAWFDAGCHFVFHFFLHSLVKCFGGFMWKRLLQRGGPFCLQENIAIVQKTCKNSAQCFVAMAALGLTRGNVLQWPLRPTI